MTSGAPLLGAGGAISLQQVADAIALEARLGMHADRASAILPLVDHYARFEDTGGEQCPPGVLRDPHAVKYANDGNVHEARAL